MRVIYLVVKRLEFYILCEKLFKIIIFKVFVFLILGFIFRFLEFRDEY